MIFFYAYGANYILVSAYKTTVEDTCNVSQSRWFNFKGRSFGEEIQIMNFYIYNIYEEIIQTQYEFF